MGTLARQQIQKPHVSHFLQATGTYSILDDTVYRGITFSHCLQRTITTVLLLCGKDSVATMKHTPSKMVTESTATLHFTGLLFLNEFFKIFVRSLAPNTNRIEKVVKV